MVIQDIKSTKEKHAPASQAISKAMWVRRYNAKRITQYGRSRATLDATVCSKLLFEASIKRHETDPLLSSSKQQAA